MDKDRRGILMKAKGQVLRLAAAIFALDQALASMEPSADAKAEDDEDQAGQSNANEGDVVADADDHPWSFEITAGHFTVAKNLVEHLNAQKFAQGKPLSKVVIEPVIAPVVNEAE